MITIENLIINTNAFFELYWNPKNGEIPKWAKHWDFNGTIPNNDKQGCYALFKDNEIVYIGVGIGKGSDKYENNGLGYRLKRYFKVNNNTEICLNKYEPTDNWREITTIKTIGFPKEHYCLAAALEIYLINKLNPERNKNHKK